MKNTSIAAALFACALFGAGVARADCLDGRPLTGVNVAGAEFNSKKLPGVLNKDYTYPTRAELAYFAGKGATTIRLPFRWERIQRGPMGPLDPGEVAAMAAAVNAAAEFKLCVVLDAHNYGTYRNQAIGTAAVPDAAFTDLWLKLAQQFPDRARVALGLMNEPKSLTIDKWASLSRQTIQALRNAGSQHLILVSGGRWSGVHEWSKTFSGLSNAQSFTAPVDPLGRTAIEVHQYLDSNFSGTGTTCLAPERFDNMFKVISDWARSTGHKLFLGEFGVAANGTCLATLDRILALTSDRSVWIGWTYWAAGRWWGNYPMSVAPKGTVDAPQMGVLAKYLGK